MTTAPSTTTSSGNTTNRRVIVYIDGFNLFFGLKAKGWKRFYWLDMQLLAKNLLRPGQSLEKVWYFTADVRDGTDTHLRQQIFLDALHTHCSLLETVRGRYLIKERQCRRCGSVAQIPEEKKTDVNIASHMIADAFNDRFDSAILISGDSDLVPPIEIIKKYRPDKRIIVAFPPKRQSYELRQTAHGCFDIYEKTLKLSLLPNPVVKPDGHKLFKPETWK